jgi:hypothetical protein
VFRGYGSVVGRVVGGSFGRPLIRPEIIHDVANTQLLHRSSCCVLVETNLERVTGLPATANKVCAPYSKAFVTKFCVFIFLWEGQVVLQSDAAGDTVCIRLGRDVSVPPPPYGSAAAGPLSGGVEAGLFLFTPALFRELAALAAGRTYFTLGEAVQRLLDRVI